MELLMLRINQQIYGKCQIGAGTCTVLGKYTPLPLSSRASSAPISAQLEKVSGPGVPLW